MTTYERIGKAIIDGLATTKDLIAQQQGKRFLELYRAAPLFIIETDPAIALTQIKDEVDGLEIFFRLPFKNMLMEFPQMRMLNVTPFLFLRQLDEKTILLQELIETKSINMDEWFSAYSSRGALMPELETLDAGKKKILIDTVINEMPVTSQAFFVKRHGEYWTDIEVTWDTYGNTMCPHRRIDHWPIGGFGLQQYRECNYGCAGKFDACCQIDAERAEKFWSLILHAVIYINYPAHIIIEETPQLTTKEQRQRDKAKKPISAFIRKPRVRVVTLEQLKIMRHAGGAGTHASPIPHQRIGHWRTLKSEKFINKRFQRIWINDMQVGDLSWSDERTTYRVISPNEQ